MDIRLEKADKDSCQIKITWPYGDVFTTEGKRTGDVWEIKRRIATIQRSYALPLHLKATAITSSPSH